MSRQELLDDTTTLKVAQRCLHLIATVKPAAKRECVDWNGLESFIEARRYNPEDTIHGGIRQGDYEDQTRANWR
jgi:hypothetical protein